MIPRSEERGTPSYRAPTPLLSRTSSRFHKLDVLFTFSLNTRKFVRLHELNFRVQLLKVLANMFVRFLLLFLLFYKTSNLRRATRAS